MIEFLCANCSHRIGVADQHEGALVKCPHCGAQLTVPATDSRVLNAPIPPKLDRAEPPNPRLTFCVACGRQISLAAHACPHCGEPRPKLTADRLVVKHKKLLVLLVLALLALLVIVAVNNNIRASARQMQQIERDSDRFSGRLNRH
jgi:DNA-directed RNA polymerase subunit RPC12/RpoP